MAAAAAPLSVLHLTLTLLCSDHRASVLPSFLLYLESCLLESQAIPGHRLSWSATKMTWSVRNVDYY